MPNRSSNCHNPGQLRRLQPVQALSQRGLLPAGLRVAKDLRLTPQHVQDRLAGRRSRSAAEGEKAGLRPLPGRTYKPAMPSARKRRIQAAHRIGMARAQQTLKRYLPDRVAAGNFQDSGCVLPQVGLGMVSPGPLQQLALGLDQHEHEAPPTGIAWLHAGSLSVSAAPDCATAYLIRLLMFIKRESVTVGAMPEHGGKRLCTASRYKH